MKIFKNDDTQSIQIIPRYNSNAIILEITDEFRCNKTAITDLTLVYTAGYLNMTFDFKPQAKHYKIEVKDSIEGKTIWKGKAIYDS